MGPGSSGAAVSAYTAGPRITYSLLSPGGPPGADLPRYSLKPSIWFLGDHAREGNPA